MKITRELLVSHGAQENCPELQKFVRAFPRGVEFDKKSLFKAIANDIDVDWLLTKIPLARIVEKRVEVETPVYTIMEDEEAKVENILLDNTNKKMRIWLYTISILCVIAMSSLPICGYFLYKEKIKHKSTMVMLTKTTKENKELSQIHETDTDAIKWWKQMFRNLEQLKTKVIYRDRIQTIYRDAPQIAHISNSNCWGMGSSKEDVRRIQGTPDSVDGTVNWWYYGRSYVSFDSEDKVISYANRGNLMIE